MFWWFVVILWVVGAVTLAAAVGAGIAMADQRAARDEPEQGDRDRHGPPAAALL